MRVSVALCTYNGGKYISEQIESILNQTIKVDEIVICDDSSSDTTVEIINRFQSENKNIFLHINETKLGIIKNFEKCIRITSGDIIFLSDQDDIWLPEKAELLIAALELKHHNLLVFSDGVLIDDTNEKLAGNQTLWGKWGFTQEMQAAWRDNIRAFYDLSKNNNKITGATLAFKSRLKNYIFPFELPLNYWHDAWLGLVAASRGGLVFVDKATILYRIHSEQQIGINMDATMSGDKNSLISATQFSKILYRKRPALNVRLKYALKRKWDWLTFSRR